MIPKAKDYSSAAAGSGSKGMGVARDFTAVNVGTPNGNGKTKAATYYGGDKEMAKSVPGKKVSEVVRTIPGIKVTNPLPSGGTRQVTLPRGAAMQRRK